MTPEQERELEAAAREYSLGEVDTCHSVDFKAGARHQDAIAYARGRLAGLAEAAKIAKECGSSNVENPAIDMFERQRRMGIRWCGEFIVSRIRALLPSPGETAKGEG